MRKREREREREREEERERELLSKQDTKASTPNKPLSSYTSQPTSYIRTKGLLNILGLALLAEEGNM